MYGFTITQNGKTMAKTGDICYKNIVCTSNMINKFEQDKVFAEDENYIIMLDGFILNSKTVVANNTAGGGTLFNALERLYEANGEQFFSILKGSYSGALYDKAADKWIIFCDQIGSKFTFYALVGDVLCVAEEMGQLYEMMRRNDINYKLSIDSSYLLLTFGFMIEDKTLCEQVKKIQPGCYIVVEKGTIIEKEWYSLNNSFDTTITENDAIEIVDQNFRKAVDRVFRKDKENGYDHIVALSGGLDSRMTSLVAHDLGYTKQLNFTFSQSDYLDETIAKRIASDYNHEWLFKSLDNGLWLFDVDEITSHTGGNVLYYGSAHGNNFYKLINFAQLGIIHTGQISGGLNGSSVKSFDNKFEQFDFRKAMYSTKYYDNVKHLLKRQINQELGWYYYRCLNGTCYGTQIIYNYTESYSPFLDIDFLEHLLRIPISFRINHHLYKRWILSKYPNVAKYKWETTGRRLDAPILRIGNREIPWANIPKSIGAHIKIVLGEKYNRNDKQGMNPIAYYVTHNKVLREQINGFYNYIDAIDDIGLRETIKQIHKTGSPMEEIQAVSLLSAVKLFFS